MAKKNAKGGGGKQSADNRPRKRPPQAKGGSGIDLRLLLGVLAVAVCGAAAWFFAGGEDDAEGGGAARRGGSGASGPCGSASSSEDNGGSSVGEAEAEARGRLPPG